MYEGMGADDSRSIILVTDNNQKTKRLFEKYGSQGCMKGQGWGLDCAGLCDWDLDYGVGRKVSSRYLQHWHGLEVKVLVGKSRLGTMLLKVLGFQSDFLISLSA